MITRKVSPKEKQVCEMISAVAFEMEIAGEKDEGREVNGYHRYTIASMSDDENTIYGSIVSVPYKIRYDGNEIMMSGIRNVSTLPPYRRMGAIRECFRFHLNNDNDLNPKDFPISYLYPFNTAYYRQFGYETHAPKYTWTIGFEDLDHFDVEGDVQFLIDENGYEILDEIYDKMYKKYNLSSLREKHQYEFFEKRDTFNKSRYAYVWRNKNGVPKGYMIFKKERDGSKIVMNCSNTTSNINEFAFVDAEGLCGLLNFAKTFASNYNCIKFTIPSDIEIQGLLKTVKGSCCQFDLHGMIRVTDVEKIFEISKYKGSGKVKIKINDIMCDRNNGIFEVEFSNDKCVKVNKVDSDFDISMDISTFSSLIVGSYQKATCCFKPDLIINKDNEDIDKVFYYKPNAIIDLF